MTSEIRAATVGVSDLDRSVEFYRRSFGYEVRSWGALRGTDIVHLWGGSPDQVGRGAVVSPPFASTGLLRLIEIEGANALYWGPYDRIQDYGHYALNIRVSDLCHTISALEDSGGRRRSGPTRWALTDDLAAIDSLSYDPDGVLIDVFQLHVGPGSPLGDLFAPSTALQTVALHASDARRSACFYAALGLRPLYDKKLAGMEEFFELPAGTVLHNINMMWPQEPDLGRVEIAQYLGFPGQEQRMKAVAGALGILSIAFETTSLEGTTLLLRAIGAEPAGEECRSTDAMGRGVTAQAWFGPDGERLEFYQLLD